mmetsp:Transcript_4659/g.14767  ORF Transcript_4659/g.14767 Transcript_4659/m.14767 type:complete len:402 (-) Transcript_4659:341-1546(-)
MAANCVLAPVQAHGKEAVGPKLSWHRARGRTPRGGRRARLARGLLAGQHSRFDLQRSAEGGGEVRLWQHELCRVAHSLLQLLGRARLLREHEPLEVQNEDLRELVKQEQLLAALLGAGIALRSQPGEHFGRHIELERILHRAHARLEHVQLQTHERLQRDRVLGPDRPNDAPQGALEDRRHEGLPCLHALGRAPHALGGAGAAALAPHLLPGVIVRRGRERGVHLRAVAGGARLRVAVRQAEKRLLLLVKAVKEPLEKLVRVLLRCGHRDAHARWMWLSVDRVREALALKVATGEEDELVGADWIARDRRAQAIGELRELAGQGHAAELGHMASLLEALHLLEDGGPERGQQGSAHQALHDRVGEAGVAEVVQSSPWRAGQRPPVCLRAGLDMLCHRRPAT